MESKPKEPRYKFQIAANGSGTKRKTISVKESDLTPSQKDFMYAQFMESYLNLPEEIKQRFFQSFLNSLQKKLETPHG